MEVYKENQEIYTKRIKAGKRTYFFDIKSTRASDYYITITESKKQHGTDRYEKHKIFLYKEDLNKFLEAFHDTVEHIKKELLPHYDFDKFNSSRADSSTQPTHKDEGTLQESA